MPFNEKLAGRIRAELSSQKHVTEKKMFGGIAFMVEGKMCVGIVGDRLMARVDKGEYAALLKKPHVRPMDFTGKPMKGFLFIEPAGIKTTVALRGWIKRCLAHIDTMPASAKSKARQRPRTG